METILNFNGLYGESGNAVLPDFVHCEPLETRSRHYNWVIKRHIHAYLFQVFCLETGTGTLLIEQQEIGFAGPCFIVIPENTLHGFVFGDDVRGTVLTLSVSYVERLVVSASLIHAELSQLRLIRSGNEPTLFADGWRLIGRISGELFDSLPERDIMLQSLFTTFLATIFRLSYLQNEHGLTQTNRSLSLFRAFLKRVKESRKPQKTITDYAGELDISPVHLNRICRSVAQKSAVQVVQGYFVVEAQKYLTHTSFSIAEVAYALNFDDPAYFSRLFKKHTALSPKQFREQAGQSVSVLA